jgi:hypothetical protein
MYAVNQKDIAKDLQRQNNNLVVENKKATQMIKIKSFEEKQKAKKETLKQQKKENNESKVDTSIGYHTLSF